MGRGLHGFIQPAIYMNEITSLAPEKRIWSTHFDVQFRSANSFYNILVLFCKLIRTKTLGVM